MKNTVLFFLLALFSVPSFALYKCEEHGNISYSDKPCPNGKKIDLEAAGTPTPSQNANSRTYWRDQSLANRAAIQSKRNEARADKEAERKNRAAEAKQKKCLLLGQRRKWAEEDVRIAHGKAVEKKKRAARRAEERYMLQCGAAGNPRLLQ